MDFLQPSRAVHLLNNRAVLKRLCGVPLLIESVQIQRRNSHATICEKSKAGESDRFNSVRCGFNRSLNTPTAPNAPSTCSHKFSLVAISANVLMSSIEPTLTVPVVPTIKNGSLTAMLRNESEPKPSMSNARATQEWVWVGLHPLQS